MMAIEIGMIPDPGFSRPFWRGFEELHDLS